MDESTETVVPLAPPATAPAEELARALGVSVDTAERLVKAGHTSVSAARELSAEALTELGISAEEATRLRPAPPEPVPVSEAAPEPVRETPPEPVPLAASEPEPTAAPEPATETASEPAAAAASEPALGPAPLDSDRIVERWAGTVRRPDRTRRRRPAVAPKESAEVLRKWVDGDDRAMEDWIHASEADRIAPAAPLVSPPTPGPADQKYLYGHIWVVLAWVVRHPLWGTIGLPLLAKLYVRQKDIAKIPKKLRWTFQTKLEQAADLVAWAAQTVFSRGKQLWIVAEAIRKLNEDDLRFLNRLIVERLNLIHQARSTYMLAHFSVGDRVRFSTGSGEQKSGVVVRLNKKTASIATHDGQHWKVHPGYLSPDGPDKIDPPGECLNRTDASEHKSTHQM